MSRQLETQVLYHFIKDSTEDLPCNTGFITFTQEVGTLFLLKEIEPLFLVHEKISSPLDHDEGVRHLLF